MSQHDYLPRVTLEALQAMPDWMPAMVSTHEWIETKGLQGITADELLGEMRYLDFNAADRARHLHVLAQGGSVVDGMLQMHLAMQQLRQIREQQRRLADLERQAVAQLTALRERLYPTSDD